MTSAQHFNATTDQTKQQTRPHDIRLPIDKM